MASPQTVAAFRVQALERSRRERHTVCFNAVDWSRGQEERFGQATAEGKQERSKADAGSPSSWDVNTVERSGQGGGEYGAGGVSCGDPPATSGAFVFPTAKQFRSSGVRGAINVRKGIGVGPGDFPITAVSPASHTLATVLEPLPACFGFVFDPEARAWTIQPEAATSFALIPDWLCFAHFLASSRRKAASADRKRPGTVGLSRPFPRGTRFQSCRSSNHQ